MNHRLLISFLSLALLPALPAAPKVTTAAGLAPADLAAGVPFYWRIETGDGLTVHAYRIDPEHEVYRPA